jgi:hypothetical protein
MPNPIMEFVHTRFAESGLIGASQQLTNRGERQCNGVALNQPHPLCVALASPNHPGKDICVEKIGLRAARNLIH